MSSTPRAVRLGLAVALAAVAGSTAYAFAARGSASPTPSLAPDNFAALQSSKTAIAGVPAVASALGAANLPGAGGAHRLGAGAIAWTSGGRVCWVAHHAGGCVADPSGPIDAIVGDSDGVGSGAPAHVMGVAIDGVTRISVTLKDGRTAAETPVANFYFVDLPADARPWDVRTVTATLADGTTYSHDWSSVSAPAAP